MIPKLLSTKRFWIYEILAAPLLSLNFILWIGRNIESILLIGFTFFASNMVAWIISKNRILSLCLFSWLFGGCAYVMAKLKNATSASDLKIWGILDIFFCGLIGGILVLCLKDEDLAH